MPMSTTSPYSTRSTPATCPTLRRLARPPRMSFCPMAFWYPSRPLPYCPPTAVLRIAAFSRNSAGEYVYRTAHQQLHQRTGGVPASTERNDRIGLSRSAAVLHFQFESVVVTAEFHPLHARQDTGRRSGRFDGDLSGPD